VFTEYEDLRVVTEVALDWGSGTRSSAVVPAFCNWKRDEAEDRRVVTELALDSGSGIRESATMPASCNCHSELTLAAGLDPMWETVAPDRV
jgi:hypothetical protein